MKKHLILLGLALLGLATVLVWNGCKKDSKSDGGQFTCKITSPKNGAELSVDEDITVTVEAKGAVSVTAYLDDIVGGAAMTEPFTMTISSELLKLGQHTIKAIAITQEGKQAESSITVTLIDGGGGGDENESPSFVTFANGEIPPSWKTNTWMVDIAMGYDDNYSLRSKEYPASVLTKKTLNNSGYIEFYTKGDNFELYIDRVKTPAISSTPVENNWIKWIYTFNKGTHEFLWETTLGSAVYLDAIRFAEAALPKVATTEVTNITTTTATSGGNVVMEGNSSVTARGVCWSTSQNPTINDSKTTDGSGTGSFTSNITGLSKGVLYYLRAYATNSAGTAYGEQRSFSTSFSIGEAYQGGIVFYIDETGKHGLIAAKKDQSTNTNTQWWNGSYINTGATGTAIGTGKSNTEKIIQAQGAGSYAAKLCADLVIDGYNDWFLPSKDELNLLYQNRDLIGGFNTDYYYSDYWSSSEYSDSYAWRQDFYDG